MRHLSYANIMASVAVFVALGGGAYAAVHVNGKDIENHTIAGKKIKNNTLGGKQINEGRLGEVPRAAQAGSATTATSADTAASAASATTATTATRATTADTATTAANAADAATLGGDPPSAFVVSCPATTTIYGGVCWDNTPRTASGWIAASDTCGNAGGRLPSLSELIAYTDQPGTQVTAFHWSGDVVAATPSAVARDETGQFSSSSHILAYRCVFYRTN